MTPRRRAAAALALLLGAVLATFTLAGAHQHREAVRRLDAANAALVSKDYKGAAFEAHAAALRAWPRSDAQRRSFELLERTARAARAAGDATAAMVAWTEMRHAAIAVRSVVCDTAAWQREAEDGARGESGAAPELPADDGGAPTLASRLSAAAAAVIAALALAAATRKRSLRPAKEPAPPPAAAPPDARAPRARR